ncbi:hypothetical protein ARGLB_114_00050 [Arthrobacter globiformis NBRC 12137]|uniref:Uncharacterized protein n=1 Tax=Arthrobacter globiformis (strain ATCC 8010 / DSM 20124 / JCM 1332 / NBRC 12137 / NCIMB 8907 / NRRL B-2979 / 168) TaxID=1077972 RepID=H0QTU4_ARTG1|nr:hypothetical protein ARGLB_114_00050 [Arthrobacter globiformis NBRC 12137]
MQARTRLEDGLCNVFSCSPFSADPTSWHRIFRSRYWAGCYGTLQAMWKHRGAVVQGGQAGKLGRRGLGYLLVLQVLLPLFAPVVDVVRCHGSVGCASPLAAHGTVRQPAGPACSPEGA